MNRSQRHPARLGALGVAALLATLPAAAAAARGLEYLEKHVRPLLAAQCQACHNAQLQSGGIDLSSAQGFQAARDQAALISARDPESSRLLAIVGYESRVKMPPGVKLPSQDLEVLRGWVRRGAPWPGPSGGRR